MINLSDLAASKLKEIMEGEGEVGASLRIQVMPSPHGGAQYALSLDGDGREEDTVLQSNGVQIVVDPDSLPLLEGTEIDYVEGLMRSGFVINNPNIQSTGGCACGGAGGCGCGGSGGCGCGGEHQH